MKYCPYCGAVLPDGAPSFCPECGEPLPDGELKKTVKEENLIYIRYCPELLDFKFDRGHSIDEKSVKAAERINKKYPFMESLEKQKYFSDIDIYFEYKPFAEPAVKDGTNQPDEWCRKVFHSEYIKQNICRLVSEGFYEHAGKFAKTHSYQSLRAICVAIAIAKVDYDVVSGQNIGNTSIYDFLEKMAEGNYYE